MQAEIDLKKILNEDDEIFVKTANRKDFDKFVKYILKECDFYWQRVNDHKLADAIMKIYKQAEEAKKMADKLLPHDRLG